MNPPTNNPPQHGYTVATVLLLTAVVAIGMAAVQTLVSASRAAALSNNPWSVSAVSSALNNLSADEIALRALAGGVIGLFVGIGIGATRLRPIAGVLLGIFVGVPVGAFACATLTQRENLVLVAIGSALLIALGAVVRLFSRKSR